MKILNTPLPVHENTVMESEFDEVEQPRSRRKRKPHRTRADHKHQYESAYCEEHFLWHLTGTQRTFYTKIEYCSVCGRINSAQYYSDFTKIPAGAKVFRTPLDDGKGYVPKFIPDLSDFYFKE